MVFVIQPEFPEHAASLRRGVGVPRLWIAYLAQVVSHPWKGPGETGVGHEPGLHPGAHLDLLPQL